MSSQFLDRNAPSLQGERPKSPEDLPHGLIEPTDPVRRIVAREKAKFSEKVFTPQAEERLTNDLTLQDYFDSLGYEVAYRSTPRGPEVLAVSYDFADEDVVILGDTNILRAREPAQVALDNAGFRDLNAANVLTTWSGPALFDRIFVPETQPEFASRVQEVHGFNADRVERERHGGGFPRRPTDPGSRRVPGTPDPVGPRRKRPRSGPLQSPARPDYLVGFRSPVIPRLQGR